jgi:hypothetical protein
LQQIRQDCFKRGPVAVDVRYDCDAQANKRGISATDRRSCQAAASDDDWYAD